jgi:hypothetical protein
MRGGAPEGRASRAPMREVQAERRRRIASLTLLAMTVCRPYGVTANPPPEASSMRPAATAAAHRAVAPNPPKE